MTKRVTTTHEWIETAGEIHTVGITQAGIKELGEIVHVELPKMGELVSEGDTVVVLESTKAAVDVYSPVSGKVTAVNHALQANLSLINHKSESDGWLYKVAAT